MNVEKDTFMELFSKLEQLSNQQVVITLKNGKKLYGKFVGFFKADEFSSPRFAKKWHVIPNHDGDGGFDIFGLRNGTVINHEDIAEVFFTGDNSSMRFE